MRVRLQILGRKFDYPTDIATPQDILLLREEIKEIDTSNPCKICGHCCNFPESRISRIFLSKFELNRIKKILPPKRENLFDRNRIRINSRNDCVFLEDKKCGIQNEKPLICRAYPYYKIGEQKFQCKIKLLFPPHNLYQHPQFIKYLLLVAHDTASFIERRNPNISAIDLEDILTYINGLKNKFIPLDLISCTQTDGANLIEVFYFLNVLWLYFL